MGVITERMKSGASGLILESPFHNPLRQWNSFTPNGLPSGSGTAPERALKAKNQNPLARGAKTPSFRAFLRAPDAGSGDPAYRGLTGEAVPCRQGAVPRSQPITGSPPERPQRKPHPNTKPSTNNKPKIPQSILDHPAHSQRQRDRAGTSIEGKHPKSPRAPRENPILPCRLPASSRRRVRRPGLQGAHR